MNNFSLFNHLKHKFLKLAMWKMRSVLNNAPNRPTLKTYTYATSEIAFSPLNITAGFRTLANNVFVIFLVYWDNQTLSQYKPNT